MTFAQRTANLLCAALLRATVVTLSLGSIVIFDVPLVHAQSEHDAYRVLEAWAAAFNSGDPEKVIALYAPDATMIGSADVQLLTTAEARRAYFQPALARKLRVDLGEHRASAISEDAVAFAGTCTFWREENGAKLSFPSRYTFVLQRKAGTWKIVQHHTSPAPKAAQ